MMVFCLGGGCDKKPAGDAQEHSGSVVSAASQSDNCSEVAFSSFALRFMSLNNLSAEQLPIDSPKILLENPTTGKMIVRSGEPSLVGRVTAYFDGKFRPIEFAVVGRWTPVTMQYLFEKHGSVWEYRDTHVTLMDMQANVREMPENAKARKELHDFAAEANAAAMAACAWQGADSPEALVAYAAAAIRKGYWEDFLSCIVEQERGEVTLMNVYVHLRAQLATRDLLHERAIESDRVDEFVKKYNLGGLSMDEIAIKEGTNLAEMLADAQRLSLPDMGLGKVTGHDYLYFLGKLEGVVRTGDSARGMMVQPEDAPVTDTEVFFLRKKDRWYLTRVNMAFAKHSKEELRAMFAELGERLKAAEPAQAQPAGSTAAGAAVSGSATQPAAREPQVMQSQDRPKPAAASQPATQPAGPRVVMQTSMGKILIELFADQAPITVENFLKYVDAGFYDGTIFHRVIPTFMIQGGGFGTDNKEKQTRPEIKNESRNGLKNLRGTIAMARKPNPDSATAQFFINVRDNPGLDYPIRGGYAVFGKVVEGMDVVDKIKAVPTGKRPMVTADYGPQPFDDVPQTQVVIESVKRQ
jgi:peptidyl-prolyl cis-trans isomerase A (cyclophilin A)